MTAQKLADLLTNNKETKRVLAEAVAHSRRFGKALGNLADVMHEDGDTADFNILNSTEPDELRCVADWLLEIADTMEAAS